MVRRYCTALITYFFISAGVAAAADPEATANPPIASADAGTLQEVVVTARRRSEDLQNVPIAVTALNAEQLRTQNVQSLTDVTAVVPNIEVNAGRATSSTINAYIRGVGQNDPLWGFEPGVGIYLDDVYIARPQGALLDLYDVDRIEVLRGPQGTLYGKNTIGGAIKYITRDITSDEPYFKGSVTGGSYDERDVKLAASTPIVPSHVYFGVAAAYLRHDGWGQVEDDGLPRPYNRVGQDVDDKNVISARGNLTFVWGESSKLKLLADTMDDRSNAAAGQRLAANPYLETPLDSRYDTYTDMPVDKNRFAFFGYSGTYTQEFSDAWSFKAVAAYRQGEAHQFINFSELNAPLFEVPGQYADHETTGEMQVTYTGSGWKGVGGLYYFNGTAAGSYNAVLSLGGASFAPGFPPGLTQLTQGSVITNSVAAYFDTTWNLTSRLNLDVGARWNEDQKKANVYVSELYAGTLAPNATFFNAGSPPPGFVPLGTPETDYDKTRRFANVSPRLGFDYHFIDDVMGYVSYSRGFKSGGFDMRGNAAADPSTENGFASETADSYEAGVKSSLWDKRLTLNLTVFYSPYKDVQITTQQFELVRGAPTNVTAVLNAGKQLNQGVEFESAWRPIQPLTFTVNAGYLDSYYEDFLFGCTPPAPGCVVNASSENKPIDAPRWTSSLAGVYVWNVGSGDLSAHSTFRYQSFTKLAATEPSVTDQGGYSVLDAGLAYALGKSWRFAVEGKNILDKGYRVAGYDFGGFGSGPEGGLSQIGFYGPPRTILASVMYTY
ncbi:MAG: TonB-dependent receptor [Steroidobacteraceae bacterium]